jgi:hypothetical protein
MADDPPFSGAFPSETSISEGGECPGGTTKLHGQRSLAVPAKRMHLPYREGQPPRRLEAESDRQRLLEERPPGHQCVPVLLGKLRARCAHPMQSIHEEVKSLPHLKHQGGVDRILARGSPVNELLRIALDACRQHAYQGNRGCASHHCLTVESRDIEQFLPAISCDDGRSLLWDDPGASFRAGERGLKCEHFPHMRLG